MSSKNVIIVYARMASTRLPGKALLSIGQYSLIELVIQRIKQFNLSVDADIMLATTNKDEDNALEEVAIKNKIHIFRGDEHNVVKRTVDLLNKSKYQNLCRVNGDCPLVDGDLIKLGYKYILDGYDFVTNIADRSFPYGIALEWMNAEMYLNLSSFVKEDEKEHVTKHIYRIKNSINYFNISNNIDESKTTLTIDNEKDLLKIRRFLNEYPKSKQLVISYKQILNNNINDNNI